MSAAADLLTGTGAGTESAPVRKPRGPSKKMRAAMAAEFERGRREGSDAAREGAGVIVAVACVACAVVGFGLGAVLL